MILSSFSIQISDETFELGAKEILEEVLTEVMLKKKRSADQMVADVVHAIAEAVPIEFLKKDEALDIVADKVNHTLSGSEVDKEAIAEIVESRGSIYNEEMMEILNIILERIISRGSVTSK